jgi:hypothetical protein
MARPGTLLRLIALVSASTACSHPQRTASDSPRTAVSLPTPGVDQARWMTPLAAYFGERNLCIERELARRDLNEFGDPLGTTYTGSGPPGVTTTVGRYKYVFKRRPDIAAACTKLSGEVER